MSPFELIGLLAVQLVFGCLCFLAGFWVFFRLHEVAIKQVISDSVQENSKKTKDGGTP